ncbi:MAG: hypothetical protein A2020_08555 [Lentisphaerae bacterium GWF2_45_14]|nr:MAG: hypothetical protein A2020_08555 [Lentisphaerae bacterium GWF2_45_14]
MSFVLRSENITFKYEGAESPLLDNFSFGVKEQEFCCLIGPGGAGKTTVFKILSGFLRADSGNVLLKGRAVKDYHSAERAKILAVVPQTARASLPFTARQIVEMGRFSRLSRFASLSAMDRAHINEAMEMMDVSFFSEKPYNCLSGGEKQRVRLAAALAQEPSVMLLDEPAASLDIGHSASLMKLLKRMNQERKIAIVIISHDIQTAAAFFDRMVLLRNGKILADGPPSDVMTEPLIGETYDCRVSIFQSPEGRHSVNVL